MSLVPTSSTSSSSSSSSSMPEPSSLSRVDRRKLKKLRKLIDRGGLSSSDTIANLASSSSSSISAESLLSTTSARVELSLHAHRDQLKMKEVQHLLLWLAREQMKQPTFASAKNRGLITGIVVVLLKGLTYAEWESETKSITSAESSTTVTSSEDGKVEPSTHHLNLFLKSMMIKRLRHSRLVWNAWQRIVTPFEEALFSLPRNALVVNDDDDDEDKKKKKEEKEKGGKGSTSKHDEQSGKKRKRTKDEEEEEEGEDDEEEEDDEQLTRVEVGQRLFAASLTHKELIALEFPHVPLDHHHSVAPSSTVSSKFSKSGMQQQRVGLPKGRVAGTTSSSPTCTLKIPDGYILTRTAHIDLHKLLDKGKGRVGGGGGELVEGEEHVECPLFHLFSEDESRQEQEMKKKKRYLEQDEEEEEEDDDEEDEDLLDLSFCQLGGGWPRVVALDCEMCTADDGVSQLARVSCIDGGTATIVVDEFVLPERKIVDYLTQFSGVTQQDMEDATMTMEMAQEAVADLLDGVEKEEEEEVTSGGKRGKKKDTKRSNESGKDGTRRLEKQSGSKTAASKSSVTAVRLSPAFAAGHSLDFDLRSLRIIHTRILDTSVLYRHHAGLPYRYSLKHLSLKYLGKEIQQQRTQSSSSSSSSTTTESKNKQSTTTTTSSSSSSALALVGHSSVEDAESALQLLEAHIQSPEARVLDVESMNLLKMEGTFVDFYSRTKSDIVDAIKANSAPPPASVSRGVASAMAAFASHAQSFSTASSTTVSLNGPTIEETSSSSSSSQKVFHIRPQRSILALPDMLDSSKVRAPVILGSPSWVASLVAGVASGKPIKASVPTTTTSSSSTSSTFDNINSRTHKTVTRIVEEAKLALLSGGSSSHQLGASAAGIHRPLSLTIAEMETPRRLLKSSTTSSSGATTSSLPDVSELDSAFSSMCSRLPLGTVVMVASQGSQQRFGAGIRHSTGKLSDEDLERTSEAQVGCLFLHVCNR